MSSSIDNKEYVIAVTQDEWSVLNRAPWIIKGSELNILQVAFAPEKDSYYFIPTSNKQVFLRFITQNENSPARPAEKRFYHALKAIYIDHYKGK